MSPSDCQNCTGGRYCNQTGLTWPVGKCDPGYYCPRGSSSITQNLCPEGHYCELGSEYPQECPEGTASNRTGLKARGECPQCPEGFHCATRKLTKPTGPCSASYYCPTGSISDKNTSCPSAMHCPEGSAKPQYCPDGNYTAWPLASSCAICPPGFYCVSKGVIPGMYAYFVILITLLITALPYQALGSLVGLWVRKRITITTPRVYTLPINQRS